jgi:hypothetical protein
MKTSCSRRRNSGQVLIITSLVVVMLLLSSVIYVAETQKNAPVFRSGVNPAFSAVRQAARHAAISALANISRGGDTGVLVADLNQFKSAITNNTYNAVLNLEFALFDSAPYQDGVWISWGSSGEGVSSVCVGFELDSSEPAATHHSEYAVNVTSRIAVSGYYERLTGAFKEVNVTCTLFNEGEPALAQNFTVYYEYDGSLSPEEWLQVSSVETVDYGNGTYSMSFTAETSHRNDPMLVSLHCSDLRGVFIQANATCTRV